MDYKLHHGDCIDVMAGMEERSVDAVVTDPPAGIAMMGKSWDNLAGHGAKTARGREVAPALELLQAGGALQSWEAGFLLFTVDWASEAKRLAKPGAHSLTWALPRTSDLTKMGLRLAGWEIRETVYHLFASGFPKSHDISKAIDRHLGKSEEREVIGTKRTGVQNGSFNCRSVDEADKWKPATAPATPEATQWNGWGTALKPAAEEWILARKPIAGTIAANVLEWGTGGLNIDACRIPIDDGAKMARNNEPGDNGWKNSSGGQNSAALNGEPAGRWPANVIHDGSDEVLSRFPKTTSGMMVPGQMRAESIGKGGYNGNFPDEATAAGTYGDTGSAARFFYCAKASRSERSSGGTENNHPTVKPLELMVYLCQLITPPGATILDPFMGSGSTGVAALETGRKFIGIELDDHYFKVASERIEATSRRLQCLSRKASDTHGDLPLFAESV